MSVNEPTILRITAGAVELDGFVRSFELSDDIGIVSIRRHENGSGQIGKIYPDATDEISLDLHFGTAASADSAYELVLWQFHSFQRDGISMKIEHVHDRAGAAE